MMLLVPKHVIGAKANYIDLKNGKKICFNSDLKYCQNKQNIWLNKSETVVKQSRESESNSTIQVFFVSAMMKLRLLKLG